MISIEIDAKQIKRLKDAVGKARKSLPKELAAAINETAKQGRTQMGRNIRSVVNMSKKTAEKALKVKEKATAANLRGVISLGKEQRKGFGLQHFGGRQNKKGVSYRISKTGGRKMVAGAFMGPKPGQLAPKLYGGVFKRVGKSRLPIVKLYGVSPFAAYAKNDFTKPDAVFITKGLQKNIERRINLNVLRANGLVTK